MPFKTGCIIALILFANISALAQDTLYTKDGKTFIGKVKSIDNREIVIERANVPVPGRFIKTMMPRHAVAHYSRPLELARKDVSMIRYENGTTEIVKKYIKPINYWKTVFAFAPIQATEDGWGIGLTFEHALRKDGLLSFYMPMIVTFEFERRPNDPAIGYYNRGPKPAGFYNSLFYFMPGVKFYPTGMYNRFTFSTGASMVVCTGHAKNYTDTIGNSFIEYDRFKIGIITNNAINWNASKHFYIGMELGLGFSFVHTIVSGIHNGDDNRAILTQFAIKTGVRF